jgi:hypothetical protein
VDRGWGANSNEGTDTVVLQVYYNMYFVYCVCSHLSVENPIAVIVVVLVIKQAVVVVIKVVHVIPDIKGTVS